MSYQISCRVQTSRSFSELGVTSACTDLIRPNTNRKLAIYLSHPPRNKSAKDTFFLNPFVPVIHSTQKRGRLKDNVRHQNKVVFSRWKSDARVPHTMGFSTKNCVYRPGNNDCRSFSSCHWSGRGVNTTKTKCTVHTADSARLTG